MKRVAYGSAWELWHRGADEAMVGLSMLAKAVGSAGMDYHGNESVSAEMLRGCLRCSEWICRGLADAVERMGEFERYSESMLAEIDSLVTNLHATWSGEASAAHSEAHQHWAYGEAVASLKSAGVAAHGNYTGVAAKDLGMWS
jgi:uncharacterized protein YukE